MPTCREVTQLVASDALASAGWHRRLMVRLHLVMCVHCRRYVEQLRQISHAMRYRGAGSPEESGSAERLMGRLREQWKGGTQ